MNDLSRLAPRVASPNDVIARLAAPEFFTWENPEDFDALRTTMMAELEPSTPYEAALAENLVRYEWDMARLQHFWDTAVLATFRDLALKAMLKGDPTAFLRDDGIKDEDRALVRDLVSSDPAIRRKAEEEYRECSNWEPAELFGLAYTRTSGTSKIEDRIADLERRRRTLRADYAALKAARRLKCVADAEIVEAADANPGED